jgi:hypothetical protein
LKRLIQSVPLILVLVLIINLSIVVPNYYMVHSANSENINNSNVYSRISKSNDLTITMQFEPKIPIIYHQTKIFFQINHLNGSEYVKNLTAFVTILNKDGGLYKFGNLKVSHEKFFINYIFQNNMQNKIIVQLYRNNSGVALASFDFQLLNTSTSTNNDPANLVLNLFKNFLDLFKYFFK